MRNPIVVFLTLAFVTWTSSSSHANPYNINAVSCTPTSGTFRDRNYFIVAGSIGYLPGHSGEIRMNCQLPTITTPTTMKLLYRRTSGSLSAVLIKVAKVDGSEADVAGVSATDTSGNVVSQSVTFTELHNNNYVYFVEIDFVGSSSDNIVVYGLTVE